MGRHDEAIAQTRVAVELEPTSSIISRELGYKFLMARRFPEAIAQFQKTIELDPSFAGTDAMLTEAYWYSGMVDEAVAQAQNLDDLTRQFYEALGRGETDAAVEFVDAIAEQGINITVASRHYAVAGAKQKSLDLLEEAVRQRVPQVLVGQNQAAYDPYRGDPRFVAIRESIGLEP
jgi:tetratricopeptide (TPR) repeat protein